MILAFYSPKTTWFVHRLFHLRFTKEWAETSQSCILRSSTTTTSLVIINFRAFSACFTRRISLREKTSTCKTETTRLDFWCQTARSKMMIPVKIKTCPKALERSLRASATSLQLWKRSYMAKETVAKCLAHGQLFLLWSPCSPVKSFNTQEEETIALPSNLFLIYRKVPSSWMKPLPSNQWNTVFATPGTRWADRWQI